MSARQYAFDEPAAEHTITVVDHRHLPLGHGANRFGELDARRPAWFAMKGGGYPFVPVANLHRCTKRECDIVEEARTAEHGAGVEQIVGATEAHRRPVGFDPDDERWCPESDSEPFALTNRKLVDPLVGAHLVPVGVEHRTRTNATRRALFDKGVVAAGRHEAELLALAFGGPGEGAPHGILPNFGFLCFSERKDHPRQLLFGQRVEKIALIFGRVFPPVQFDAIAPR